MQNPLPDHSSDHAGNTKLTVVHITQDTVANFELTPPHPPRTSTALYLKSHADLVFMKDMPCVVCGVRNSTLKNSAENRFNATCLETHHYPIERSLLHACDPLKMNRVFSQVTDRTSLELFVDSEQNLIVLCDVHHRSIEQGIHHLLAQDFAVLPYLWDHYQIVAKSYAEASAALAANDAIEKKNGYEL